MGKTTTPRKTAQERADTVDRDELKKFAALADEWWDPQGKFRALHRLNPARLTFIRDEACAHFERAADADRTLAGLSVLDIGCGGGLIAEPLTRLGANVTAIDASTEAIQVANRHATQMGLDISYRRASVDHLVEEGNCFDIVLNLEVVEHVADAGEFLQSSARLVGSGGMLVAATLNRTLKAYALAIIGAEYLLGWLPRGTHDWRRFIRPSELASILRGAGLTLEKLAGITYSPITDRWSISSDDLDVNYMALAFRDG
jgi:2-polyprenyl-6-hydroxyphenyl methylase/3-demethylubiquinone-9 3-methyltransferase